MKNKNMKEELQEELREISPFLAGLEQKDPFKAPKFYFDNLADKVLEKAQPVLVTTPPQYATHPSLFERLANAISTLIRPRLAIAMATIALVAAVGGWMYLKSNTASNITINENISHEEIHQYIQENIADFDDYLLLDEGKLAYDTEGGLLHKSDMSDEEIEQYLEENLNEKDLETLEN
jgi:hypothetical protein